jgi:hypothetical protein
MQHKETQMKILALTNNSHKIKEYKEHFALYGIKKSLEIAPPMMPADIKEWLLAHSADSFAFRETSDLYALPGKPPLTRPYTHPDNNGLDVVNTTYMTVWALKDGALVNTFTTASITGKISLPETDNIPNSLSSEERKTDTQKGPNVNGLPKTNDAALSPVSASSIAHNPTSASSMTPNPVSASSITSSPTPTSHATSPAPSMVSSVTSPVFDWDDIFVPHHSEEAYHAHTFGPGKLSSRTLVMDEVIQDRVSFTSNRAFKYGKLNASGVVDLNWHPLNVSKPIQFDTLPIDLFMKGDHYVKELSLPQLDTYGVRSLFTSALTQGAHFRAASSRREWIYWAPGINAGIPLTPKENSAAELVYLAHDIAHYALPDLIITTPKDAATDKAIIIHRMLGECLAMVTADMFFMEAMLTAGMDVDATSHGIHPLFANSDFGDKVGPEIFYEMFKRAAYALLLGDTQPLMAGLRTNNTNNIEHKDLVSVNEYTNPVSGKEHQDLANGKNRQNTVGDKGYQIPVSGGDHQDTVGNKEHQSPVKGENNKDTVSNQGYKESVSDKDHKDTVGDKGYKNPVSDREHQNLVSDEDIQDKVSFFMKKYTKFALADYEWTHLNLMDVHKTQDRQTRWVDIVGQDTLNTLGLTTSQGLMNRQPALKDPSLSPHQVVDILIDDILTYALKPRMDAPHAVPEAQQREEILTNTYKRYITGQLALYARYPNIEENNSVELTKALTAKVLTDKDGERLRSLFEKDVCKLKEKQQITSVDLSLYLSVFPIVKPHYVSYATPNYLTHQDVFKMLKNP